MIQAIALDDEPPALRILTHFCAQNELVDLVSTFTNPEQAQAFLNTNAVDLLFLDINMPGVSGLDFYRAQPQPPMVIFTTAYADYAVEGFTLNAVDYLLKPFTAARFEQAIQKAASHQQPRQPELPAVSAFVHIRADYTLHQIPLSDILYVEGLDDYIKIFRQSTTHPLVARMTMKAIQEKLPTAEFVRVHRSFIVARRQVEAMRGKTVLVAGREIPVGARYDIDLLR